MVKYFTIDDWNQNVPSKEGTIDKGILIPISEPDPIIQVFRHLINDQYQLATTFDLFVGVSPRDIMIISKNPFKGKVVIK